MRTITIRWRALDATELPAACAGINPWRACRADPVWVRSEKVETSGVGSYNVLMAAHHETYCEEHGRAVAHDDGLSLEEEA